MSRVDLIQLIKSGAHFGHLTRRWNPKMKPYIFMEKNGIHIIDLKKTQQLIDVATEKLNQLASEGKTVLFVGTKKQAQSVIDTEAISRGLNDGIERMAKIMMPALFGVILIMVIYGMVSADFGAAVEFLFNPDFSKLTGASVLMALGQALFSLGVGVGLMITYAAYMPVEYSLRSSAVIICVGDTIAALLAGLAIFPIVFANNLDPAGGPGLVFVTLPIAFGNMPGGQVIGVLFFMLLFFAAFTSAVGMLEPLVAWLEEKMPGRRKFGSVSAGLVIWLLGLGSVFSFNIFADVNPLGFLGIDGTFFYLVDFLVANVLLPINALMIAVFAGWVIKRSTVAEEFSDSSELWKAFWRIANRYVAPVAIGLVLFDLLRG